MKCGFVLGAAALLAVQPALAEGCGPLTAALIKGLHVPWHATLTTAFRGEVTKTIEIVSLDNKTYVKTNAGSWQPHPRDPNATDAHVTKDWERSTCEARGAETIGGETADIVAHHTAGPPGQNSDTRFWIAQSSGLVVKTELTAASTVVTTLYDYRDVNAPAE